jgi:hypothetical protein
VVTFGCRSNHSHSERGQHGNDDCAKENDCHEQFDEGHTAVTTRPVTVGQGGCLGGRSLHVMPFVVDEDGKS